MTAKEGHSDQDSGSSSSSSSSNTNKKQQQKKNGGGGGVTFKEFTQRVLDNPAKYFPDKNNQNRSDKKKKKTTSYKRTRKRVENPQQTYLYATQRRRRQQEQLQQEQQEGDGKDMDLITSTTVMEQQQKREQQQAKKIHDLVQELKLVPPSTLQCDPEFDGDDQVNPQLVGQVRVSDNPLDDNSSLAYAYLIDKPAGWAILGSKGPTLTNNNKNINNKNSTTSSTAVQSPPQQQEQKQPLEQQRRDMTTTTRSNQQKLQTQQQQSQPESTLQRRVKIVSDEDGTDAVDYLEYNERDVFALMTAQEIQNFLDDDGGTLPNGIVLNAQGMVTPSTATVATNQQQPQQSTEQSKSHDQELEGPLSGMDYLALDLETITNTTQQSLTPTQVANIRRIQARAAAAAATASANHHQKGQQEQQQSSSPGLLSTRSSRPSVVNWLKDHLATSYNRTIRGGTFWKALAGATQVDDSGLVLLCPKSASQNIYCDAMQYVAVVGTGGYLATNIQNNKNKDNTRQQQEAPVTIERVAKLTKARLRVGGGAISGGGRFNNHDNNNNNNNGVGGDIVETVRVTIPERPSTCHEVVSICQEELGDGIRGDPLAHPLDRRARRRLIHCQAMTVSSLVQDDDPVHVHLPNVPDDIALWSERRGSSGAAAAAVRVGRPFSSSSSSSSSSSYSSRLFTRGSFLGRHALRDSTQTTAYREINGASDGFPGWTVDRYDKWLLVQHDPQYPRGPLPSIHDGATAGVYYLETSRCSSSSPRRRGPTQPTITHRPRLLEGQPAPELIPVLENGITYLVSLEKDLSTGLFLDQRPQRQWLTRHCGPQTRVLNCFAHTGAFSVAAAMAGASTVSIDLSKKWLDRLPMHFQANHMTFDERHDVIYGDCFDWLNRLSKRGETFDIVILDPPSSSFVGSRKKKRWSIQQDTEELVALAAPLVQKSGGSGSGSSSGGLLWTTTNHAGLSAVQWARLCRRGLDQTTTAAASTARLERIQPMSTDYPSMGPQNVKNLIWRFP